MQPSSFQIHKLQVLVEFKELLAQFYLLCYQKFPEHKELLKRLYYEKKNHAQWIKGFSSELERGSARINPTAFKVEAMRFFMKGIISKLEELKTGQLTFHQVLVYIKDTENSMLEQNFFNIFQKDSPGFRKIKEELESERQQNLNNIQSIFSDMIQTRRN
jgi:hypothetical protein